MIAKLFLLKQAGLFFEELMKKTYNRREKHVMNI